MNYTYNWNNEFIKNTVSFGKFDLCLEIGCFEGLTSNYICDHLLNDGGKLICVDPLTENYLNTDLNEEDIKNNNTIYKYFNNQYDRFINNVSHQINENKLLLKRNLSEDIFPSLISEYEGKFDLIYIDGDHRATAVYNDAINSFKLLSSDGIMIFDDYSWGEMYNEEATSFGIDKFLLEHNGKFDIISKSYQVVIRKK